MQYGASGFLCGRSVDLKCIRYQELSRSSNFLTASRAADDRRTVSPPGSGHDIQTYVLLVNTNQVRLLFWRATANNNDNNINNNNNDCGNTRAKIMNQSYERLTPASHFGIRRITATSGIVIIKKVYVYCYALSDIFKIENILLLAV